MRKKKQAKAPAASNTPSGNGNNNRPRWSFNRWMLARQMMMNTTGTQTREALLASWANRDIDMNYECRWPNTIIAKDYKDLFERHGVANRVVTVWPDECWILPPDVYEVEDQDQETEFEKVWTELDKKLHLISCLHRLDIEQGIGRFGVLFFGLNDLADTEKFSKPVPGINPVTGEVTGTPSLKLLYLKVFQESDVQIAEKEQSKASPRYGLPKLYTITMENPAGDSTISETVHWSRVLHVVDNRLSSDVYGEPRMKPVYNDLIDLRKTKGGASEGYWRACLSGIMWGLNDKLVDPTVNLTDDQKDEFMEDLEKYHNSMQHDLISFGLVPHDIAPKLVDPTPFAVMLIKLICIQIGVPFRIFMGSEEAQLASGEDRTAWIERVAGRQENYLTPYIIRPFVERLQAYGVLPQTKDQPLVDWPERDKPSEGEIAETSVKTTDAMSKYVQGNVGNLMGEREYLGQVLKKTPDEIEAIASEVEDWQRLEDSLDEPEPEPVMPGDNNGGNPKGVSQVKPT